MLEINQKNMKIKKERAPDENKFVREKGAWGQP